MTTVLVTGAAGFIGSHLCDRLLAEGKRVVGVDDLSTGRIANLSEARTYERFTFHTMDVRAEQLRTVVERHRPEVVMHLAAQPSVAVSMRDPVLDASVNVLGLLNVLEAAVAAGSRKVVFAASGGTLYGEARRFPVPETARRGARPVSPYGISKALALDYLRLYRARHGLDFTALALANVYGPRQDPHGEAGVVAIFTSRMLAGESPTIFGDGTQTRDYVYVDDTVHAFALAAGDRASGLVVNVGTGLETSVNRLYQLLAEVTGFRGEPRFGPPREGDLPRSALDLSLASRALGWTPWTTLEEGLRATVEWFRAQEAPSQGRR
ncbi:MAG TPA: NAD-dependent epimerase/dehydratase family protein [Actinomycetota bacterium]|nr:NAD-dependent epimerase/dehydratase family protein [Actinomycetota bacterium]